MGLVLITNPVPPPLTVRPFWPFDDWLPIYFPGNGMAKKVEVKTSNGSKIPEVWGPFAYDSKDQQDPFLLRRRIK